MPHVCINSLYAWTMLFQRTQNGSSQISMMKLPSEFHINISVSILPQQGILAWLLFKQISVWHSALSHTELHQILQLLLTRTIKPIVHHKTIHLFIEHWAKTKGRYWSDSVLEILSEQKLTSHLPLNSPMFYMTENNHWIGCD